ncbi:MAG: aminotransferase class I/II-fold pyridoxal phosphate-dependent enzyme, partial [Nanoarchaeota archaeon]
MVHISERELELPDAVISKLLKIAAENKNIISLGPGEPDFNLPEPLLKAVKNLKNTCNHYSAPGGRKELKEALIKKLKRENKINAEPKNVIVTCGSQEALMLASMCSLDVGEEIVLPDPGFMGYESCVDLISAVPVKLELREDECFSINPDRLKKIVDKKRTKVILINTPSNPTGQVLSRKVLEDVADIAVENDLYIFSDEAYERLIYDKEHVSIGSLNGMEDYVVSFYTFSKSYAMCGFRVGYAVGPRELIDAMTKTHIYSTLCAPTPSQIVAEAALKMNDKYVQAMVDEYKKRRNFIYQRLN